MSSGPQRLGGDRSARQHMTPREACRAAAERRAHDSMWCPTANVAAGEVVDLLSDVEEPECVRVYADAGRDKRSREATGAGVAADRCACGQCCTSLAPAQCGGLRVAKGRQVVMSSQGGGLTALGLAGDGLGGGSLGGRGGSGRSPSPPTRDDSAPIDLSTTPPVVHGHHRGGQGEVAAGGAKERSSSLVVMHDVNQPASGIGVDHALLALLQGGKPAASGALVPPTGSAHLISTVAVAEPCGAGSARHASAAPGGDAADDRLDINAQESLSHPEQSKGFRALGGSGPAVEGTFIDLC
jgi:hypothetical protein